MAKYSMELRKVCDYYTREEVEKWFKNYELTDFLRPDEIESIQTANIWSKDRLAKKIVDHYFMREIGFETPALFKHYAMVTMQEIMEETLEEENKEKYLPQIYDDICILAVASGIAIDSAKRLYKDVFLETELKEIKKRPYLQVKGVVLNDAGAFHVERRYKKIL